MTTPRFRRLASTLPDPASLPERLEDAVTATERHLARIDEVRALVAANATEIEQLTKRRFELEAELHRCSADALLNGVNQTDADRIQEELNQTKTEIHRVSGTRPHLMKAFLDEVAKLPNELRAIDGALPEFAGEMVQEFLTEFFAASETFALILARGKALADNLGVQIDMQMPLPAAGPVILPPGVARVRSLLDKAQAALNQADAQRRADATSYTRRKPFIEDLDFPYTVIRQCSLDDRIFQPGEIITGRLVGLENLRRLHKVTKVTPSY